MGISFGFVSLTPSTSRFTISSAVLPRRFLSWRIMISSKDLAGYPPKFSDIFIPAVAGSTDDTYFRLTFHFAYKITKQFQSRGIMGKIHQELKFLNWNRFSLPGVCDAEGTNVCNASFMSSILILRHK